MNLKEFLLDEAEDKFKPGDRVIAKGTNNEGVIVRPSLKIRGARAYIVKYSGGKIAPSAEVTVREPDLELAMPSLKGAPKTVTGEFDTKDNKLTSIYDKSSGRK